MAGNNVILDSISHRVLKTLGPIGKSYDYSIQPHYEFSSDGNTLFTLDKSAVLKFWNVATGSLFFEVQYNQTKHKAVKSYSIGGETQVAVLVITYDSGSMFKANYDAATQVEIRSLQTGKLLASHTISPRTMDNDDDVAFDESRNKFYTVGSDKLNVFNAKTGLPTNQLEDTGVGLRDSLFSGGEKLIHNANKSRLALSRWDGTVVVWDTESSKFIFQTPYTFGENVDRIAFHPTKDILYVGYTNKVDNKVLVAYDLKSGKELFGIPARYAYTIVAIVFTPDASRVLTLDGNGVIHSWNSLTGLPSL